MANANSTALQPTVSIPYFFSSNPPKQFVAYCPVILINGEYDDAIGINAGGCITLDALPSEEEALKAAHVAYLSTPGAIGYSAKGVSHE